MNNYFDLKMFEPNYECLRQLHQIAGVDAKLTNKNVKNLKFVNCNIAN